MFSTLCSLRCVLYSFWGLCTLCCLRCCSLRCVLYVIFFPNNVENNNVENTFCSLRCCSLRCCSLRCFFLVLYVDVDGISNNVYTPKFQRNQQKKRSRRHNVYVEFLFSTLEKTPTDGNNEHNTCNFEYIINDYPETDVRTNLPKRCGRSNTKNS